MTLTFDKSFEQLPVHDQLTYVVTQTERNVTAFVGDVDETIDYETEQTLPHPTGLADVYSFDEVDSTEFIVYKTLHGTPLYASLSCIDESSLVNVHEYMIIEF